MIWLLAGFSRSSTPIARKWTSQMSSLSRTAEIHSGTQGSRGLSQCSSSYELQPESRRVSLRLSSSPPFLMTPFWCYPIVGWTVQHFWWHRHHFLHLSRDASTIRGILETPPILSYRLDKSTSLIRLSFGSRYSCWKQTIYFPLLHSQHCIILRL